MRFSILASVTFLSIANACVEFERISGDGTSMNHWAQVGGLLSLSNYCGAKNCCQVYNDNAAQPCANDWNLGATYKICPDSCNGNNACKSIAQNSASGSTIEVGTGACSANISPCKSIQRKNNGLVNVIIPDNKCSSNTEYFEGVFRATEECCSVIIGETAADDNFYDTACFGSDSPSDVPSDVPSDIPSDQPSDSPSDVPSDVPSDIPSDVPSDQPSDSPSDVPSESPTVSPPCKDVSCNKAGKCALSPDNPTKPTCICENTFELTFDKRGKPSCTCNSDTIFHANVNRCFPITSTPSSTPTLAPSSTQAPSSSPSQNPSMKICVDDELATFTLIKNLENSVGCSWILQNKKRADVRKERYCGLDRVSSICPASCGLC